MTFTKFNGRIAYLIVKGSEDERFTHWHSDKPIVELLKGTLNKKEFEYIMSFELRSYEITSQLLELKVLQAINFLISGELATVNALDRVKKFEHYLLSDAIESTSVKTI